jgi:hypothetical protein
VKLKVRMAHQGISRQAAFDEFVAGIPLGRPQTREDIGEAVTFLAGVTAYRDAASRLRFQRPSVLQATPYRQDTFTRADHTGGWGTAPTRRPLSVL